MSSSLRVASHLRLLIGGTALVVCLCLALGACGSAPSASSHSPTSTPNPLSAPSGGSCGSGCSPKPTVTLPPPKLAVNPTELSLTNTCVSATVSTQVQLSNTGSGTLSWSIGSGNFTPGPNTIDFSAASGTVTAGTPVELTVQGLASYVVRTSNSGTILWFDVIGPNNTFRMTIVAVSISAKAC
ncbi:MAG: hypothetical protein ACLQUY_18630 [Ktedonobacterales bacterium]